MSKVETKKRISWCYKGEYHKYYVCQKSKIGEKGFFLHSQVTQHDQCTKFIKFRMKQIGPTLAGLTSPMPSWSSTPISWPRMFCPSTSSTIIFHLLSASWTSIILIRSKRKRTNTFTTTLTSLKMTKPCWKKYREKTTTKKKRLGKIFKAKTLVSISAPSKKAQKFYKSKSIKPWTRTFNWQSRSIALKAKNNNKLKKLHNFSQCCWRTLVLLNSDKLNKSRIFSWILKKEKTF